MRRALRRSVSIANPDRRDDLPRLIAETFVVVVAVFAAVATVASLIPARRATRIDPQVALRAE